MSWVRNFLIAIGAFWLSHEPVALVAWPFMLANNGVSYYGDSLISAIANGVVSGMGRAVCAGLGAAIVTLSATGEKPQRWAWIVALLYVFVARPHYHWMSAPTTWERVSQGSDLLWPALVCLMVAAFIGRRRLGNPEVRKSDGARSALSVGQLIKKHGIVKSLWVLSCFAALAFELVRFGIVLDRGSSASQFPLFVCMFALSFPAGILAVIVNNFCSSADYLRGRDGMVFFWSLFFVAGYVQWFVLIPALRARTKMRRSG